MAKVKRYDIKTDKSSFSISAVTKKDMHSYMAEHNLYGDKKTFHLKISSKSIKTSDHITELAKLALKYDDSKVAKEGLIILKHKQIEVQSNKDVDKQRDSIFEAMDDNIKSKQNIDTYFQRQQ